MTQQTDDQTFAFRDPTLSTPERVADLLARLTLEEKVAQITQFFHFGLALDVDVDIDSLPPETQARLRQPALAEAAVSRGEVGSIIFVKDPKTINRLQRVAIEQSRHGIPLLFGMDVIHGLRTVLPVPLALAATWSPELVEAAQSIAAREARAVGIHWTFAPMIDIARDPRWGRMVEGAGEDPVLTAAMAAAQVKGFQGSAEAPTLLAGAKHLAGYGAARGGRDYDDAEISDSELWNVYLPPFRAAVEAGVATVMAAYMDLNGVPGVANRWLLRDVLRDELGFDGIVVSDANAVRSLVTQHFARDSTDAAIRALDAGLDMEMTARDPAFSTLPAAVAAGLVDERLIDEAASRVLAAKFTMGLFERPYVDEEPAAAILDLVTHRDVAREAAAASFVLLKNSAATLPLDASQLKTVAVIGQLADSKRDTLGPWIFDHQLDETVTILEGLRTRLDGIAEVEHAPGAGIPNRVFPSLFDSIGHDGAFTPEGYDHEAEIARAVDLAARASVAVVVVGQRQNQIGEKASTSTLDLPGAQLEQLQRIVQTGTPVVLLVMSGRPLDLRWADQHVPAIMQVWYPGTRGGDAVAAVLLGDESPAGRLPMTWPRHVGQVPLISSHLRTFLPEEQNARYFEESNAPLYPFGWGLSYGAFRYDSLMFDRDRIARGEEVSIEVRVSNESDVDADEVVQLYIHQRSGESSRPVRELKGFTRVRVPARGSVNVTFTVGPRELRYWSAVSRRYVQDAAEIDVWVGGDSTAELSGRFEVV